MKFLADHWYGIVFGLALVASVAGNIYSFSKLTPEQQKEKVREWLIWAVAQAEIDLGGGTGQLKLRKVYGMFIVAFPWMVKAISFAEFSDMVDVALEKFKEILENNAKVKELVDSGANVSMKQVLEALSQIPAKEQGGE